MAKKDVLVKEGVVVQSLPDAMFRVQLSDKKIILAHLSGKMRLYKIKVMPGDKVKLELSPYDETKGRIVYRTK